MKKIGFLAGTFDPVHNGHVKMALAAIKAAGLEAVYFLPEKTPRLKTGVTGFKDRLEMLRLAVANYKQLDILETKDQQLSISKTLPQLEEKFAGADLYMIFGNDIAKNLDQWPQADKLLSRTHIIIAGRQSHPEIKFKNSIYIKSPLASASSSQIRRGNWADLDPAVKDYIKKNRIYS